MSLRRLKQPLICNSKGEPIVLTSEEQYHADMVHEELHRRHYMRLHNSLGYEIPITTLTTIMKKISEQKYFEIPPAEYMPVKVGDAAWSEQLTTYRSFDMAGEFEQGIINTGGDNSRLASADAGVDALNIKVYLWAKSVGWNIGQLEFAAKSGNWDVVSAKEEARKKNWDLGIQRIAFLGARGQNAAGGTTLGLLNQAGVTTNTSVITKPISKMTTDELKAFTAVVIDTYRSNCNRTCWPTHFIIPESDYNGLASQASADFPIKSTLQLLEETFQIITRNKQFKILPCAYSDAAYHADVPVIATKQVYVLLNYDEKSVRMDVPLAYTNTLANSLDNFSFQNVGYGQFTGVLAYRPAELFYMGY